MRSSPPPRSHKAVRAWSPSLRAAGAALLSLLAATPLACHEDRPPARPVAPPPAPKPAPTVSAAAAPTAAPEVASAEPSAEPEAPPPPVDTRPRIGSIRWVTYIWSAPQRDKNTLPIGSIRYGTSLPLRKEEPLVNKGCETKWYPVEPMGWVCADDTTTLDLETPYYKALAGLAPAPGPWPYKYVFSTGAPMYSRVPTKDEIFTAEHDLGPLRTFKSLGKWSYGHERLVSTDAADEIKATDPIPEYLKDHATVPGSPYNPHHKPQVRFVPNGSGFSYVKAFEAEGRVWLLTPELLVVPADRVFPYKRNHFKGQPLGGDVRLPVAWVRGAKVTKYKRGEDGSFQATTDSWTGKVAVPITSNVAVAGKVRYHETKESGVWIPETDDVSVVEPVDKLPRTIGPDEKWLDARLLPGTMTAYVGLEPVFTTLWSGGKGGVPRPGGNSKQDATTELGTFAFQWKDAVATMSPDKGAVTVFWFADVPHIQYVHAPLAMHVSFWHGDFGFLRSAECLNLSAQDGQWLFDWTLPALPEGWGSVRPSKATGPSTKIVIRKE
jgi:hypothetical protein